MEIEILFEAASKIANDTKQMQLDVNDFGNATDELSKLFMNFTKRLQNINIINDVNLIYLKYLESLKKQLL